MIKENASKKKVSDGKSERMAEYSRAVSRLRTELRRFHKAGRTTGHHTMCLFVHFDVLGYPEISPYFRHLERKP